MVRLFVTALLAWTIAGTDVVHFSLSENVVWNISRPCFETAQSAHSLMEFIYPNCTSKMCDRGRTVRPRRHFPCFNARYCFRAITDDLVSQEESSQLLVTLKE